MNLKFNFSDFLLIFNEFVNLIFNKRNIKVVFKFKFMVLSVISYFDLKFMYCKKFLS